MGEVILKLQGKVEEVKESELRRLKTARMSVDGTSITLEILEDVFPLKSGDAVRFFMSTSSEDIESEVDGLFMCTLYKIEERKEKDEETTVIYGSIGGLKVRIETKDAQVKVEAGDKVYIGLKKL
ncbi:MAG: DNA-directed RNA polymerase subunit G [Candidatus Nezhaarchaeota archaeon]|nr:DNA-directed RNA polymerase subunit G [Candidatus Nezhaarchaeota archaeon]